MVGCSRSARDSRNIIGMVLTPHSPATRPAILLEPGAGRTVPTPRGPCGGLSGGLELPMHANLLRQDHRRLALAGLILTPWNFIRGAFSPFLGSRKHMTTSAVELRLSCWAISSDYRDENGDNEPVWYSLWLAIQPECMKDLAALSSVHPPS